MTERKAKAPEVTLIYRVSWWQRDERDALVLHHQDHDEPQSARVQYMNCPADAEAGITRMTWDEQRARWSTQDLMEQERGREETREVNARGMAAVRALIEHARGRDGRTGLVRSLDELLADDNPAKPTVKVTDVQPLTTDDPAACIVCDYLCEHGLTPHHPVVPAATVQERF